MVADSLAIANSKQRHLARSHLVGLHLFPQKRKRNELGNELSAQNANDKGIYIYEK